MNYIYLIGQALDFIGAFIIFYFGSIPSLNTLPGSWMATGSPTKIELWRSKWFPKIARYGFLVLSLGFLLQIIPSVFNICVYHFELSSP
jgi:hypothetical protein